MAATEKSEEFKHQGTNSETLKRGGNPAYIEARLQRDRPDLHRRNRPSFWTVECLRKRRPAKVVHHKDGNRSNNDPSNLQPMTMSDHSKGDFCFF
jgi:HNH endonuclease